jgi:hypothetical protein
METYNDIEIVGTLVLIIWSIALVWWSWQIHVMTRALAEERAALRRWVRLKGLREAQQQQQERGRRQ